MAARTIRRLVYWTLGVIGVALSLVALFLLGEATDNTGNSDNLYNVILLVNVAGVVALLVLTIGNLWRLFVDNRRHEPGARLKTRVVAMFVGLVIAPLLVVFYFSVKFINTGIDNWFSVEVEDGLDAALDLSRASIESQMRDDLTMTMRIADRLQSISPTQIVFELASLRREAGASEVTIYGRNSRIVATSSDRGAGSMPAGLRDEVVLQIRQNRPYVSFDELNKEIRTAVPFISQPRQQFAGVVQAHFPIPDRIATKADDVTSSYNEYQEALFFKDSLKVTFSLSLTVVLMLSLVGFYLRCDASFAATGVTDSGSRRRYACGC